MRIIVLFFSQKVRESVMTYDLAFLFIHNACVVRKEGFTRWTQRLLNYGEKF